MILKCVIIFIGQGYYKKYQNFNQIVLRSDFIYLDTKHIGFFFIAAQMERERTSLEQALEKLLDQKHI